jgi:GNAT superfamily N-acetyltransferase
MAGAAEKKAISLRAMRADDISEVFNIRTSVAENDLSIAQLEELDITPATIASTISGSGAGWVAEDAECVVAFVIADMASASIFALFVLSRYEGMGLAGRLLDIAVQWLQTSEHGSCIWLTTDSGTRAQRFYEKRGWVVAGTEADGSLRLELHEDRVANEVLKFGRT